MALSSPWHHDVECASRVPAMQDDYIDDVARQVAQLVGLPIDGWEVGEELADASDERRDVLAHRLRAVRDFLAADGGGDAAAAAARMGVTRESFYRILRQVRDLGPIRGALPYAWRGRRPRLTREGLGTAGEAAVELVLADNPLATDRDVIAAVQDAVGRTGGALPSPTTIRVRLAQVRPVRAPAKFMVVGTRIVAAVRPVLDRETGRKGVPFGYACVIRDTTTRLVIGADVDRVPARALDGAIKDAASARLERIRSAGVPFAASPDLVRLVLPPATGNTEWIATIDVEELRTRAVAASLPTRFEVLSDEARGDDDAFEGMVLDVLGFPSNTEGEAPPTSINRRLPWVDIRLGRDADRWNATVLASGRPRARKGVDGGQAVSRILFDVLQPVVARLAERERLRVRRNAAR